MCGILAVLGCQDTSSAKRTRVLELSRRLKHRGPDWSGIYQHGNCFLSHQRLAIMDPASGDQPLYNEYKTIVVTVNGEIYNYKELRKSLESHEFRSRSDSEVIAHLFEEHREQFVELLDGVFSFVVFDNADSSFIVARDAIGVTPLYIGWGQDGGMRRWYNPPWYSEAIPSTPYDPLALRQAFECAVIKRLMSDVPFGVLLSGGLDSSLVAAVASRYLEGTKAAQEWGPKLHSFSIGLQGSPDLIAAKEVAECLGTIHHEFHFSVQHILYRQKEQFSDGVGYNWIDQLKGYAAEQVTDTMITNAKFVYPDNTPTTKEAYFYRMIFERYFPQNAAHLTVPEGPSVACSTAKAMEWDAEWSNNPDPSGRAALGVHLSDYQNILNVQTGVARVPSMEDGRIQIGAVRN